MNPVASAIVAGVLIIAGKWARGQEPKIDNAVGIAGIALGLALIEQMDEKLARAFGVLIVVSIAVVHFPTIAKVVFDK